MIVIVKGPKALRERGAKMCCYLLNNVQRTLNYSFADYLKVVEGTVPLSSNYRMNYWTHASVEASVARLAGLALQEDYEVLYDSATEHKKIKPSNPTSPRDIFKEYLQVSENEGNPPRDGDMEDLLTYGTYLQRLHSWMYRVHKNFWVAMLMSNYYPEHCKLVLTGLSLAEEKYIKEHYNVVTTIEVTPEAAELPDTPLLFTLEKRLKEILPYKHKDVYIEDTDSVEESQVVNVTVKDLPALKKKYEAAVKAKQEIFEFKGQEVFTRFGKYLIEYLKTKQK